MSLWDWSLTAYGREGVADACLMLQDEHQQNIPLLLWAVWAETSDPRRLALGADIARRWERLTLVPLRQTRSALKPAFAGVSDAAREGLREDVKAAELRAERVLLEALEDLGGHRGGSPALAALEAASAVWAAGATNRAPDNALAALAAALS